MVTNQQQGYPQSSMIADGKGNLTQPWRQFFIALWNRTGSGGGGNSTFSSGDVKAIAYASAPSGWLICDGSAISRSAFSTLFDAIGTTWGTGDGSTTFNIPDMRGRMLIGVNGTYTLGSRAGAATTTLSTANLPSHNHGLTDPGHIHAIPTGTIAGAGAFNPNVTRSGATVSVDSSTTGISATDNTGSGTAVSTISPYASINWVIKT